MRKVRILLESFVETMSILSFEEKEKRVKEMQEKTGCVLLYAWRYLRLADYDVEKAVKMYREAIQESMKRFGGILE